MNTRLQFFFRDMNTFLVENKYLWRYPRKIIFACYKSKSFYDTRYQLDIVNITKADPRQKYTTSTSYAVRIELSNYHSFILFSLRILCRSMVSTPLHLTIVVYGDIQSRIVQWLADSFCTGEGEIIPRGEFVFEVTF